MRAREPSHRVRVNSPASGIDRYWDARANGLKQLDAAKAADITPSYAGFLENMRRGELGIQRQEATQERFWADQDDKHVRQLIALGGYPQMKRVMTSNGPAMRLVPFAGAM